MSKIIAYLRVSTDKQETDNQKYGIEKYCSEKGLVISKYVEDVITGSSEIGKRKMGPVFYSLGKGDIIVVTELSRLSRSMFSLIILLKYAIDTGITIHSIKEGFILKDDLNSKIMAMVFGIAADLERQRISQRTKEALSRKKKEGIILGRKKGTIKRVDRLDPYYDKIVREIGNNTPKYIIASMVGINRVTFNRYLKDKNIS